MPHTLPVRRLSRGAPLIPGSTNVSLNLMRSSPSSWITLSISGAARFDKAAEQYEKVVALTPDNALGYVNLGTINYRKERFEDARKMWLKALELDPNRFTTIMNLAKLHYEMGEYKAAIQLYERAIKSNERDYLSWGNLGIAYKHENQPAKAATALATAIKLIESELLVNPKRADLYSFAAYYHAMAGTLKNVDPLARRALELGGDDNDTVVRIAGA
jgi:tetratricopeptide (TPR) repeat protein